MVSTQFHSYLPTQIRAFHGRGVLPACPARFIPSQVSSQSSTDSTYLVVEEKQSTEQAVQICCEQREVDRRGAGLLYDDRHEAVEAKHAGTEAHVQQTWGEKDRQHLSPVHGLLVTSGGERRGPRTPLLIPEGSFPFTPLTSVQYE